MAVIKRGKLGTCTLIFRPFSDGEPQWLALDTTSKTKAKDMGVEIKKAISTGRYDHLDSETFEACVRVFQNRGMELPAALRSAREPANTNPSNQLSSSSITLWEAVQLFTSYPSITKKGESTKYRYTLSLAHLRKILGDDLPMRDLWVPELREYCGARRKEGAANGTIGWELSTLSKLFGVLIENARITGITINPCSILKDEPLQSEQRNAYLSRGFVEKLIEVTAEKRVSKTRKVTYRPCPDWFEPIIWTGYCTGMRRGEILNLRRSQVRLDRRMIYFGSGDKIKEGKPKRVPLHASLIPILEKCLRVSSLSSDRVFLMKDSGGVRPVKEETVKSAWRRMLDALDLDEEPNFHDLRHTFKANCRRSLIPESISERILGHADADGMLTGHFKVSSRYGDISDQEFVDAIDRLTFDHGDTTINGRPVEIKTSEKNVSKTLANEGVQ
jgi:integrase